MKLQPTSCDTFVVLPPCTTDNLIIFGKNSDRPAGEVQEIIYQSEAVHPVGTKLKCTYIEIDQVPATAAVILSKPSWMWGAEMGSNQYGLCIGNEAVWTKLNSPHEDAQKRLLGMDLVRLGLERGKTALEALQVITQLLDKHGQGGPCSDTMNDFTYHNSFLIVDRTEAWVLETAGKLWAAEKVESGYRHISNNLSIGTKIDLHSPNLHGEAESLGFWKKNDEFHFANVFTEGGYEESGRVIEGRTLLNEYTKNDAFDLSCMMKILRNEESGICMCYDDSFQSTSSQISILTPQTSQRLCCHWFTGTPDPMHSIFKPFVFPPAGSTQFEFTTKTVSPTPTQAAAAAAGTPVTRSSNSKIDRAHPLYKAHKTAYHGKMSRPPPFRTLMMESMEKLESCLIEKIKAETSKDKTNSLNEKQLLDLYEMFNNSVELELDLYNE